MAGFVYSLLHYPLLVTAFLWLAILGILYLFTRIYIFLYEHYITWRGTRQRLRRVLRSSANYEEWCKAAKALDDHLGNDEWKDKDEYAYYNFQTVQQVLTESKALRVVAQSQSDSEEVRREATDRLRAIAETCVKSNFAGLENPRLYSQTYLGTKNLVQEFLDESKQ